jgi:hypothetical protein
MTKIGMSSMKNIKPSICIPAMLFAALTPMVKASNDIPLEQIIIYGRVMSPSDLEDTFVDCNESIGTLDVTSENIRIFRGMPTKGSVILYAEKHADAFIGITYSQGEYRLQYGNTYGLLPIYKGQSREEASAKMNFNQVLSDMNLKH